MAKKLIFVDFDGTIFNTKKFSQKMAEIFKECQGVDFFENRPVNKHGLYDFCSHLKSLPDKTKLETVKNRTDRLFFRAQDFLFEDAEAFLKEMANEKLFLITKGTLTYQAKKVFGALKNLEQLFTKILISDGPKTEMAANAAARFALRQVFYIDDNAEELAALAKIMPGATTIHINRNGSFKTAGKTRPARNLQEAIKIIHRGE